jgi:hypothetical protein
MKTFKIDGYKVTARKIETNSNYNITVKVFEGKTLLTGTILKENSKDVDILNYAVTTILTQDFYSKLKL